MCVHTCIYTHTRAHAHSHTHTHNAMMSSHSIQHLIYTTEVSKKSEEEIITFCLLLIAKQGDHFYHD